VQSGWQSQGEPGRKGGSQGTKGEKELNGKGEMVGDRSWWRGGEKEGTGREGARERRERKGREKRWEAEREERQERPEIQGGRKRQGERGAGENEGGGGGRHRGRGREEDGRALACHHPDAKNDGKARQKRERGKSLGFPHGLTSGCSNSAPAQKVV
jgi:hypothetical protein